MDIAGFLLNGIGFLKWVEQIKQGFKLVHLQLNLGIFHNTLSTFIQFKKERWSHFEFDKGYKMVFEI